MTLLRLNGIMVHFDGPCAAYVACEDCGSLRYHVFEVPPAPGSPVDLWASCACTPGRVRGGQFFFDSRAPLMVVMRDE